MASVAEIFRLHGEEYRAKFAERMLPSHLRAMRDIEACRTPVLGGQVYYCQDCDEHLYSYHSCKNRHCPKCQNHQADEWLEKQKELLLEVNYFLVTFTLPEELRAVARSNQRAVYDILFRASSESLLKLAADPRFVGGKLGMVGVLHTWTRALIYHPHVHYIVTGGGVDQEGRWRASRENFLVPVEALSVILRAKVRDELKKAGLIDEVDERVWKKDWVVHCEPVGSGEGGFKYLAPYIFRVAISNTRILKLEEGRVTFCYKESATDQIKTCTLTAEEFIRRFLQHVLPDRLVKVRYYGLMSPSNRDLLEEARQQLSEGSKQAEPRRCEEKVKEPKETPLCPRCGKEMRLIETWARGREPP
jgi:Zn finger protein HypA/HybF involved in hydrogenase expression